MNKIIYGTSYSVAEHYEDDTYTIKKSLRDGSLAVFDSLDEAENQKKINSDDSVIIETAILRVETINELQSRIHELETKLKEVVVEQSRYKPQTKRGGIKHYLISERVFNDIKTLGGDFTK